MARVSTYRNFPRSTEEAFQFYRVIFGGEFIGPIARIGEVPLAPGNSMSLNLEPDTRAETDRLFQALAVGGTVGMRLMEMFWGVYFGRLVDRFGIRWMFNCRSKA